MLREQARKIAYVQRLGDLLIFFIAWMAAYHIRFNLLPGGQRGLFMDFFSISPVLMLITLLAYTRNNLYHSNRYFSWYNEVFAIVRSHVEAIAAFFVLLYFTTRVRMSRLTFILYAVLVVILSIAFRLIVRSILQKMRRKGKNLRHIILVGYGNRVEDYIRTINYLPRAGIKVRGWVDSHGLAEKYGIPEMSIEQIDSDDFDPPDMVVIGYPSRAHEQLNDTVNYMNRHFIPTMMIPDLEYDYIGYNIQDFEGIPLIEINPPRMSAVQAVIKRGLDIGGAAFALLILSPLFLLISLAVKLTSRGPIFYGQTRMSVDGRRFTMWKFRSMRTNAEQSSGAVWARADDDRRTPIGSFLRRTSLDEIPQFWNVLIGDMSLVGPRPERPEFIEQFKEEIPAYMLRHRVKTGITGWAQVNGWRGNTSIEKRIEFDIYYIKHWSLWFDMRIMLLTFVKGFVNPNAY